MDGQGFDSLVFGNVKNHRERVGFFTEVCRRALLHKSVHYKQPLAKSGFSIRFAEAEVSVENESTGDEDGSSDV